MTDINVEIARFDNNTGYYWRRGNIGKIEDFIRQNGTEEEVYDIFIAHMCDDTARMYREIVGIAKSILRRMNNDRV